MIAHSEFVMGVRYDDDREEKKHERQMKPSALFDDILKRFVKGSAAACMRSQFNGLVNSSFMSVHGVWFALTTHNSTAD